MVSWFRLLHCEGSLLSFIINNCLVDGYHVSACYSLGFQFVIYLHMNGQIISHFIQSVIIYYNLYLDALIAPVWPVGIPVSWPCKGTLVLLACPFSFCEHFLVFFTQTFRVTSYISCPSLKSATSQRSPGAFERKVVINNIYGCWAFSLLVGGYSQVHFLKQVYWGLFLQRISE